MNQEFEPNGASAPEKTPSLSRRTVLGTAAWAAPAIALSVASPAAAASTSPTNALTLDANPKVPVNATFDVVATLMGTAVSSKSTVFSSGSGGFTFPSGNSTVTDALGEAVVTAKAPATPGTYVITATIPALNLTATITIQVTGMALYTATKAASGWKMSDVGISDAQQVLVGSGYYWALQDGVAYVIGAASTTVATPDTYTAAKAPGKIAQLEVRPNNGAYAAALGVDGTYYQMNDAKTFVATPGVADIVQISCGGGRWFVRTADGDIYYNSAKSVGSAAKWTQLPGVKAADFQAYPFDDHGYVIAKGTDGHVYTSIGMVPFVKHMQGLPAGTVVKQVTVECTRWNLLDADGNFYYASAASQTGAWTKVSCPVPLAYYVTYEGDSVYRHAIGTDGNAYQSYNGPFYRKAGIPEGQVVDVVIGSGTWTARTASGDVYFTYSWNAADSKPAYGTYELIKGASGFTAHNSYWAGNWIIGVAPSA
ncbi:hypothetical protein [uncultured Leifsonia sp.]|uniref:hypothetical protein n=1 Tax=uncultured Leifsonia sp. TaxID=340359 RepID=UPI0025F634F0|nr:hypothetical protein [uncultured Leifsonia sp.]